MAGIHVPLSGQRIRAPGEITEFLRPFGITYARWPLAERVSPDATADEILAAYAPEIEVLKRQGGYATADVINVNPQTPNLDEMLQRFNKEHRHDDDEVRFIVKGRGLFHIHCPPAPVFAIEVEAGDLINVPAGTRHWFDLCGDRTIRAIRLFKDMSGWTPLYQDAGVHAEYAPLCLGPGYVTPEAGFTTTVIR